MGSSETCVENLAQRPVCGEVIILQAGVMGRQIATYFIHRLQPIIGLYERPAHWFPSGHLQLVNTKMARKRGLRREAQTEGGQ